MVFEFNWTASIQIAIRIQAFQFPQGHLQPVPYSDTGASLHPGQGLTALRMFCCAFSLEVALTTCGRFGCWHSPGKPPV